MRERDAERFWSLPAKDLESTTPLRARDLVVECFCQAQHETFALSATRLGRAPASEDDVRRKVTAAVRAVFRELDANWEDPSLDDLSRVVAVLGQRASAWGTPDAVIRHHGAQISQLLTVCRRAH
jgi:hypothetical protein